MVTPRLASVVVTTVLLGLVAKPAAGAQVSLACPATVQPGGQFVGEIRIDVGATPLGAYSLTLTYDPAVASIGSVAGGMTSEFSGTPTTNTPTPGETNIAAFQTSSLSSPTGVVSVAKVTVHIVATGSTTATLGLTVNNLYDTNSAPITPATGTGCSVSVVGSGSTTTSTTITTTTTRPGTSSTTTTAAVTTTTRPVTSTTSTTITTTTTRPGTSSTTTTATVTTTTRTVTSTTPQEEPTTTLAVTTTTTTLITTLPESACPDAQAAVAIQAAIDNTCNCLTAKRHGAYVKCAGKVAKSVVKAGGYPKACQGAAKACAARSTCGKRGFVTCCRTNAKGATKCSIKSGAPACKAPKGGQACVGQHPSCCDACTQGCASPTQVSR